MIVIVLYSSYDDLIGGSKESAIKNHPLLVLYAVYKFKHTMLR